MKSAWRHALITSCLRFSYTLEMLVRERGKEGEKDESGRGRENRKEGGREGGRERGREGGRDGGKGGIEGGREGWREE